MLEDLTPQQRELANAMSEISERCYCASWMENLEFTLWDAVNDGEMKYGQDKITNQDIERLKQLSKNCNSWIFFDDANEETAFDLTLWGQDCERIFSQKRYEI